jgi:hypothetical protein
VDLFGLVGIVLRVPEGAALESFVTPTAEH